MQDIGGAGQRRMVKRNEFRAPARPVPIARLIFWSGLTGRTGRTGRTRGRRRFSCQRPCQAVAPQTTKMERGRARTLLRGIVVKRRCWRRRAEDWARYRGYGAAAGVSAEPKTG